MEIQVGVAKINKYASSESGDTLEVIERPHGGISVVLADGQRSGKSAKVISNMVVRKVISLLAEGVRDGAAARAASDYLFAQRGGKVQATLNILSIDLQTNTLVITRNNPAPMILAYSKSLQILNEESKSVGVYRNTRPVINEIDLQAGITVIAYSDGIVHAGSRRGAVMNLEEIITPFLEKNLGAQHIANNLINIALELDDNRPVDDISIVVIRVSEFTPDKIRRLSVSLPV